MSKKNKVKVISIDEWIKKTNKDKDLSVFQMISFVIICISTYLLSKYNIGSEMFIPLSTQVFFITMLLLIVFSKMKVLPIDDNMRNKYRNKYNDYKYKIRNKR